MTRNNSHTRRFLATATVVALSLVAGESRAGESAVFGTYHYTGSFAHGRDIIQRAFAKSIDTAPFLVRPLLRSQIRASDLMIRSFKISRSGGDIVFRALAPRTWTWDLQPGVAEQVTTPLGTPAQMVHRVRGETYVQSFRGRRTNQVMRYRLSSGGRAMRVDFRVAASFFEEPAVFALRYRRADAPRAAL